MNGRLILVRLLAAWVGWLALTLGLLPSAAIGHSIEDLKKDKTQHLQIFRNRVSQPEPLFDNRANNLS
jgi:hypothetical protein